MFYFSKSRYCLLWQCPKLLWLSKYRPELKPFNPALQARLDAGNEVGDLAMGLFGDFTEVTVLREDGRPDTRQMCAWTRQCIADGVEVICEASFDYDGLYCAVDILRKEGDGYAIYEVKSSTHPSHIYTVDISFQRYVLEQCGVKVTGTYLVCVNSDYVRGEELDIHQLFRIVDLTEEVAAEMGSVPSLLARAREVYAMETEPSTDIGLQCRDPYECDFWDYCARHLPTPSVFDLYRLPFEKKVAYYREGKAAFADLLYDGSITNPTRLRQLLHQETEQADYVQKEGIRDFLSRLSYPLYFFDFETMQPVIPPFVGSKPYAQIPFQYSLHYVEYEGGPLHHKEFLAESGTDPRRALAERLCEDIPPNACVTAYNKQFECGRLKELAELFPDLSSHLLSIRSNVVDLIEPFQKGLYYNRAMGGSFSIKSVLPALFPDDPALNYHNLEQIHNGTEAMTVFPRIQDMPADEQETTRRNMLKYCELDTYALVKIWEKLREVTQ